MNITINISKVQHINEMNFSLDLTKNKITCIVGKNGIGKTTFIKSIKNLQSADIFIKTSSRYIFNQESRIEYLINNDVITYIYNSNLKVIDTKSIVPEEVKSNIFVELPIPYGDRFNSFPTLSKIDSDLRKCIAFQTYEIPSELINMLNSVYKTDVYKNLKSFKVKKNNYYFRLNENGYYIREDYFNSGEFFIINLYRMIECKRKCIIIDEIDISLDSSAQVELVNLLREFCDKYNLNIIFTTHSLALMKTLNDDELYYMYREGNKTMISKRSYNFIKSSLFAFKGWDKYILTEDETLQDYLEYIIDKNNNSYFYKYKIIYIGGATNVVNLMKRNEKEEFLTKPENVICVLDGDQAHLKHVYKNSNVYCIPFQSIEKDIYSAYQTDLTIPRVTVTATKELEKKVYKTLVKTYNNGWSKATVFNYLDKKMPLESEIFKKIIIDFLKAK
ncbi:spermidine/putrescine ABC transporter ATP-binding protein [Photorhabdus luminescens]|nr:spermidine/putrescine ABC transporter ATP-binding protein [Photorhabdus luminescens]